MTRWTTTSMILHLREGDKLDQRARSGVTEMQYDRNDMDARGRFRLSRHLPGRAR